MRRILVLVAVAGLLVGCSGGASSSEGKVATPTKTPIAATPTATPTPWLKGKYAPAVKERIDRLASEKNCRELQREFDAAEKNGPATLQRTGSNTSDLMKYINDLMKATGCYK